MYMLYGRCGLGTGPNHIAALRKDFRETVEQEKSDVMLVLSKREEALYIYC